MDLSKLQPYVRNGGSKLRKGERELILAEADFNLELQPAQRPWKGRLSGEGPAASI